MSLLLLDEPLFAQSRFGGEIESRQRLFGRQVRGGRALRLALALRPLCGLASPPLVQLGGRAPLIDLHLLVQRHLDVAAARGQRVEPRGQAVLARGQRVVEVRGAALGATQRGERFGERAHVGGREAARVAANKPNASNAVNDGAHVMRGVEKFYFAPIL